jgi:hypothetical protein
MEAPDMLDVPLPEYRRVLAAQPRLVGIGAGRVAVLRLRAHTADLRVPDALVHDVMRARYTVLPAAMLLPPCAGQIVQQEAAAVETAVSASRRRVRSPGAGSYGCAPGVGLTGDRVPCAHDSTQHRACIDEWAAQEAGHSWRRLPIVPDLPRATFADEQPP